MTSENCDLAKYFGALASQAPDKVSEGQCLVFHPGVFPVYPETLSSDRIIIKKLVHDYNSWYRADLLWMNIDPSKARELAVFLLACIFHGPVEMTTLALTHPESDIRRLIIRPRKPVLEDPPPGLSLAPFTFSYSPSEVSRHPWSQSVDKFLLPLLALSNA